MNDMDGFDSFGAELSARLRAAAGEQPDLTAARAVLGRRVTRARRRRAAAMTGSAGLSVLLLGAVYAMSTGDAAGRVSSADAPPIASPVESVTTVAATSVPGATSVAASDTGAQAGATEIGGSVPDPVVTTASSTTASLPDSDSEELFDVMSAATEERTLGGTGGSVSVRVAGGELTFASFPIAAAGFTAEVTKDEPGELEVTFTSATHRTRVRIRLDGARLRADRSEEARPSSTPPGNTSPDDQDDEGDDRGQDDDQDGGSGGSSGSSGSRGSRGSDDSGGSGDSGGSDDSDDSGGSGGSDGSDDSGG